MIVSKKSWHYRLNTKFNGYVDYRDSCEYIRATVLNVLVLLAVVVMVNVILGAVIVIPVTAISAMAVTGVWWYDDAFNLPIASVILVMIIFCAVQYTNWRDNRWYHAPFTPTFVGQAYERVKGKFCSKLEVV